MQKLDDGTLVFSASDLANAVKCEWALMRRIDQLLGRDVTLPPDVDAMRDRAGALGDVHERRVLARLEREFPGGVVEITRPFRGHGAPPWRESMASATASTVEALRAGHPVVFQGAFFDGQFQGFADFLIATGQTDAAGRPYYAVYDSKLARSAKVTALLQLAAYADQLRALDIPVSDRVTLILGDNRESHHELANIMPVFLRRRDQLVRQLAERRGADDATPWNDPRYAACGRCPACTEQIDLHDDLLAVSGLRMTQRAHLREAGITTMTALAASTGELAGLAPATLDLLRTQAVQQLASPSGDHAIPSFTVYRPTALGALPPASAGDIFFDFEGDPLYEENNTWNIDYLFGLVDASAQFTAFWAHDFAQERLALIEFVEFVRARRAEHPDLHIYHYAAYERTHLLSLAGRHGYGEAFIDELLRENVLVDLYPLVKKSLRVGSRSYSLKKLEPLYMGDDERAGVSNAADSVVEYALYRALVESGDTDAAAEKLSDIARYNEYDCRSTLRLRNWLADRARENGIAPFGAIDDERVTALPDPLYDDLMALIDGIPAANRTPHHQLVALAASAIEFHKREDKAFWWAHYFRLTAPIDEWEDNRDVVRVLSATVVEDWHKPQGQQTERRTLRIDGRFAPGTVVREGDSPFLVYDDPTPPIKPAPAPGQLAAHSRTRVLEAPDGASVLLEEKLMKNGEPYSQLPLALTPPKGPPYAGLASAIVEWARTVHDAWPALPQDPVTDILMRRAPAGPPLQAAETDVVSAIVASLRRIERSYIAVQGPPGSGKTYTGAKVIAELVREHGWTVGVVAQSHSTVDHLLAAVVKQGVDPALVAKRARTGDEDSPWLALRDDGAIGAFTAAPGGRVYGGTMWDFTNVKRVQRDQFDLLVIDEAGQYSLANTAAVSVAAKRLLLLGDPQQLPGVTQGTHPERIDASALGWLMDGHDVLPAEFGYFLERSWRMNAALCEPVSRLSYEGRLRSQGVDRDLAGIVPGLHPVPVPHTGNSTESVEEATRVLDIVRDLLGRPWRDSDSPGAEPLGPDEIIVVAPYNAQVSRIRAELSAAGFPQIRVGTVDKFQGREAAVAIVSLAASSAVDVPRGIEFLLMKNRINVAVSRAKWAAYLLFSPHLTEFLPHTAETLELLSRFITLVDPVSPADPGLDHGPEVNPLPGIRNSAGLVAGPATARM